MRKPTSASSPPPPSIEPGPALNDGGTRPKESPFMSATPFSPETPRKAEWHAPRPDLGCPLPPAGWYCPFAPGHLGPCNARPIPSSPPAELTEALYEFEMAGYAKVDAEYEKATDTAHRDAKARLEAARSVLLALYARQREEVNRLEERVWELEDIVSSIWIVLKHTPSTDAGTVDAVRSLSSQLERQREDTERVMDLAIKYQAQLERLKAEQISTEEATALVELMEFSENKLGFLTTPEKAALEKLRRLSQQGDTKE